MNGKSKTVDLSKFGMVYYNNLLSLPICLPIAIMKGEFPQVLDSPLLHGPDAQGFILCALFSGAKRRVHGSLDGTKKTTPSHLGCLRKHAVSCVF